jgi:hypothetical protein
MRARLVLVITTAVISLVALSRPVVFDFQRYVVVSGFAASGLAWILVVVGVVLATAALFRRRVVTVAAWTNLAGALLIILMTLSAVRATPGRSERRPEGDGQIDCSSMNNPVGCHLHNLVDAIPSAAPPPSAPPRVFVTLALAAYLVAAASLLSTRRRLRAVHR